MFGRRGRGRGRGGRGGGFGHRAERGGGADGKYRKRAIAYGGSVARFQGDGDEWGVGDPGVLLFLDKRFCPEYCYFEIEILNSGRSNRIGLGLAHRNYPLNRMPGWNTRSVGYHADDGKLFHQNGSGEAFGDTCGVGDRMGCGVEFVDGYKPPLAEEDDDDDDDDDDDEDYDFASDHEDFSDDDDDLYGMDPFGRRDRVPPPAGRVKVSFLTRGGGGGGG